LSTDYNLTESPNPEEPPLHRRCKHAQRNGRTYKVKAELEAKTKEFQAAVAAAGVKRGGNVAKKEVREVESAFA
jgi:hypothetical protein